MRRIFALIFFAVIVLLIIQDNALNAATVRLEDILRRAMEKTELILAGEELVKSKKHFTGHSLSYMNPSIEASSGWKKNSDSGGTVYGISLTQPFYFPGKRALRSGIGNQDIELAKLELHEARLFVYYETMRLAAAYVVSGHRAEHAVERVLRFSLLQKYVNNRPFTSPQKRIEKYIVENKMDVFSKELLRIQSEREILWAHLNAFLDFQEKPEIEVGISTVQPSFDLDSLIRVSEGNNTAIGGMLARLKRKTLERDLAGKEAWPDFGLSAFYSGESSGERERIFGGGVVFALPVFNTGSLAVKGFDAEIQSEQLRLSYERRALRARVTAAYHEFSTAAEIIGKLPESHFVRMHRQQKEADAAFEKGLLDFVTYLEIESDIYEKHQFIFASRLEYVEKLTRLLWLSGEMKNLLQL